jgi:arsenite methyltransferase
MVNKLKETVKEKYAEIIKQKLTCGCDSEADIKFTDGSNDFSKSYTMLDGYEKDADYNLGCGIPTAYLNVKEGDTLVDLGSGAGNDVFIARKLVGDSGKVIGIDMTQEMIDKARENNQKLAYENIEFLLGDIEDIPLKENTTDFVISNCVMNLVPNKQKAYAEVFRILKPGGEFSISDIVVAGELPEKLKESAEMYIGCVAGAIDKDLYLETIGKAGFKKLEIVESKQFILDENLVKEYLSLEEFELYKNAQVDIVSITVKGKK